ncbi:MAG: hypothetical protein OEO82_02180 [Gammaproteobacteria bacterium]|nr:hypothetical protein [Gammaproteobacteria bacterium]
MKRQEPMFARSYSRLSLTLRSMLIARCTGKSARFALAIEK